MPDLISRFSSRNQRLSHVFLKDRLKGAETYDRIAGYFRSSIFDLIHEEISTIGRVRIVCATDAACEGLNLQTLGTLINVDLPWNPSRLEQRIGRIKRYGQQRREVDMANLVYAGTVDERVYQRLSERMQDRYDILGSLPDTIEDDWIENIERLEEELKSFTKPESPADVFSLRYGDFLSVDGDDRGWEVWTRVVARRDIEERLMRPWGGRQSGSSSGPG